MQTEVVSSSSSVPARAKHPNSWVFFDGEMLRYEDVRLGPMTHALHYGTGCFEGIRAYWSPASEQLNVLQAAPHYDRLRRSAAILRLNLPYTTDELVRLTVDLLRRNEYRTDTYIRPLVFVSAEEIGVRLHNIQQSFLIYTAPMGAYIPIDDGIRCMTSTWRRISDASIPARAKVTGSYVNSALAKTEAQENGFDEAIMLSMDGHVSEGSAENLFMVRDGVFVTPPVTDDILEGITRGLLMADSRRARHARRGAQHRSDGAVRVRRAAAVWHGRAGFARHRARPTDDRFWLVGPRARQLQEIYFRAVRAEEPRYREWLTPVYG